jgi:hypothetical protein
MPNGTGLTVRKRVEKSRSSRTHSAYSGGRHKARYAGRGIAGFRCIFLPDMPPSTTPGSPTPISSRAAVSTLAFVVGIPPRHSQYPRNPFHAGGNFRGFLVHTFATACQFARPPVRI